MAYEVSKIQSVEFNYEVSATFNGMDMTRAFKNLNKALNESVYTAKYLSDEGYSSSLVTGIAPVITLNGDFIKGDSFCEYLDEAQWSTGANRVGNFVLTRNGQSVSCSATLTAISIAGGESDAPNSVSISVAFNGKPTVTSSSAVLGTLSVTSTAGSSSGTTSISVSPSKAASNVYKYKTNATNAPTVGYGSSVSSWEPWNGSDDITATNGHKITIVEADGGGRAIKAGSTTVTAAS